MGEFIERGKYSLDFEIFLSLNLEEKKKKLRGG